MGQNFLNKVSNHNIGHLLYAQQEYTKAIEYFEKSIHINHQNIVSINDLGCCYYCNNNPAKAVECFKKALSLQPTFRPANFNLGFVVFQESLC